MAEEQIYPYAVARIRVLEKKLLTNQAMSQMAEEREPAGCFRTLLDYGYESVPEINSLGVEYILSKETEKTYRLIRELVPDENVIHVFLYKNDYHNLKVLIKQEISGVKGERYLIDSGTISVARLKKALIERNYTDLPAIMGQAIEEAFAIYTKTQSGQMVDVILDKAVFKQMKQASYDSKNQFLMDYVTKICDLTNLKSFLRIRQMNKEFTAFASVFVEGGKLSLDLFLNAFGTDDPVKRFKATDYGDLCESAMDKGFTEFEKQCDNFVMEYIRNAKYKALTLEPLIAYVYAKESEIKTVRIILTSKLNGISPQVIKERVREAYV